MNRRTFLDPGDPRLIEKVTAMMRQLREFDGERLTDAEEAVAAMMTKDVREEDRRLRRELLRTVASRQPLQLPPEIDPEEIRKTIFTAAWRGDYSPGIEQETLFSTDRNTILRSVAEQYGIEAEVLTKAMFADTPGER